MFQVGNFDHLIQYHGALKIINCFSLSFFHSYGGNLVEKVWMIMYNVKIIKMQLCG